jgi:hypothetical protein
MKPTLREVRAVGIATAMTILVGCASAPPTEKAAVARAAVDDAVAAGATELAPLELKTAQDKVEKMTVAMKAEHFDEARYLAEQAQADAKLAETKARAAKADKAARELEQGITILRRETQPK